MKLTAWRVALRIARRDALRAKGRSALVVAMVALPVLGVAGADVVFRSAQLDPGEAVARSIGRADLQIDSLGGGLTVLQAPDPDEGTTVDSPKDGARLTPEQQRSQDTDPATLARQLLPAGSTLIPVGSGPWVSTSTRDGLSKVQTEEADLADPVWQGRITVLDGRPPAAAGEIAATRAFLDDARLAIGDRTTFSVLPGKPYTITAAVEFPGRLRTDTLIGRPGDLVPALKAAAGTEQDKGAGAYEQTRWLVKLPAGASVDWAKVKELNSYGFSAASRSVILDPPARSEVPYFLAQDRYGGGGSYFDRTSVVILATVAGMALLEIVLLAGPAFAVGARRSRRQLGLLAAGGGDRAHVRAVVLGGGVVLGVTGAAVGLVGAIGLVALLRPQAEQYAGSRFGHFDLQPADLLGVMGIGLVTGLLAAVVPAVQASRQDVVAALTGRGSLKPPSKRLAVLGLLMVGGGAALALLGSTSGVGSHTTAVLGGSMIAELGMVALAPFLVGLFGRLGRVLPLGPRLALRDSVRHRGRTAPAVAAVMAAVAGSVAVGVYSASSAEQGRREYVASAPTGAVTLATGWGSAADGALLPQLRGAVESNVPDLGPRADVLGVSFMGDCQAGQSVCGQVDISIPKERRCPADDPDNATGPNGSVTPSPALDDPRCIRHRNYSSTGFGEIPAGDAGVLRNLYGVKDQAAEQALAAGKAVVFDPLYLKDGKITLDLTEAVIYDEPSGTRSPGASPRASASASASASPSPSAPAAPRASASPVAAGGVETVAPSPTAKHVPADGSPLTSRPTVHHLSVDAVLATSSVAGSKAMISPATAAALGLGTAETGSVWLPAKASGSSSIQRASAAVAKVSDGVRFDVERGYRSTTDLITLGLTGFAALVALGAAGIATGLAAADSQRDLTTLAAIGAAPRIRRTLSGFQCGVIAAMGAVLGTICGVVPAVALRKVQALGGAYPGMSPGEAASRAVVVFPWATMGITLVVLPLLAVGLATLLTRSRIVLLRTSG
ncbi:FtsX-like permease family protein [Kitasatospora sp. NBC_00315]|uniref:FtsX-like permease family protein n=1 Tax=Kitasatospora sp. NBC_00315 TaxID=2975963 RepID=UPI00324A9E76